MALFDVTQAILQVTLDWLQILLIVLLFYGIFRLFAGAKGPSLGWGRDRDPNRGGGRGGERGTDPDDPYNEDRSPNSGRVDYDNLGFVRFQAKTINGKPVSGVHVRIYPAKEKWLFRTFGSKGWRSAGWTNKDGTWPENEDALPVPSGKLKYKYKYKPTAKEKQQSRKLARTVRGPHKFSGKSEHPVQAGGNETIPITLGFERPDDPTTQGGATFHPQIRQARIENENGQPTLFTDGVIR